MSISEGRQCAQRPNPFQHQPPDIPPPSLAPTRATAILPKCSGKSRKPLPGQSDAANHGKLVYAVHNVTDSEQTVSDEMLLKSVAEGDKAAMHILFARHRTRVLRFIQRTVRNPGIAEDLVSQVFLDVWRSANRFESRARVSTWLIFFLCICQLFRQAQQHLLQFAPGIGVGGNINARLHSAFQIPGFLQLIAKSST